MSSKPEGFSTLTSAIIVENAQETIESYQNALGAELLGILNCPKTGKVVHSYLKLGDSTLFVYDANPEIGMLPTGRQQFYLYVDSADSAFEKASGAGFQAAKEPGDEFWGDRVGIVIDGNGNTWMLGQKVREVSPEDMQEAINKMAEAA